MFEHIQYATVYSSVIIFAPTNTNWRHSALGVETQSPDQEWPTNLPPQTLRKRETLMNKRVGRQIKSTGTPPKSHSILVHTAHAFT